MRKVVFILLPVIIFSACTKEDNELLVESSDCSTSAGYAPIENKITITQGIYGIVQFTQGDCMPTIIGNSNTCRTCPVKRKVRIYDYTRIADATTDVLNPSFFTKFNTRLVAEVESDENGFFQVNLQPGTYTLVVIENGKLYANMGDGNGGINPFTVVVGTKQADINIKYKAAY